MTSMPSALFVCGSTHALPMWWTLLLSICFAHSYAPCLLLHAGNGNAGPAGTSGGANSSELLPTPGVGNGTDATPMGPGNMRTRVSSYLPTPVSDRPACGDCTCRWRCPVVPCLPHLRDAHVLPVLLTRRMRHKACSNAAARWLLLPICLTS